MLRIGIGHRIERLRLDRSWTQAELARRAGISPNTVQNFESGRSRWPSPLILGRLAGALDLSRAEVLGLPEIPFYDTQGQATAAIVADVAGLICFRERLGLRIKPPGSEPVRNRSDADTPDPIGDWP